MEPSLDPEDAFTVLHPQFAHYEILFGRAGADGKGPVIDAGWGEDWFAGGSYSGLRDFKVPTECGAIPATMRQRGSLDRQRAQHRGAQGERVMAERGWCRSEPAPDGRFYLRNEPASPEWIGFSDVVNGKAMRMRLSGTDLSRVPRVGSGFTAVRHDRAGLSPLSAAS